MLLIPLIYFTLLGVYFYYKHRTWNLDIAATSLLVIISIFAIIIDIKDLYGPYGINIKSISLFGIMLYCVQWTFVLWLLHIISSVPLVRHDDFKNRLLYIALAFIAFNSIAMVWSQIPAIRGALIMDMAELREEYYQDMQGTGGSKIGYLMLIANIVTVPPFTTFALFFWFYLTCFSKVPFILRLGLFFASIVQAIISITSAGRAAFIYWSFDFYLLYAYFYQYLSRRIKYGINLTALAVIVLGISLFITITISRFEATTGIDRNPLDSLYGYAGQQINNFCSMFEYGGDAPFQTGRIFPLTSKILGQPLNLYTHYQNIHRAVSAINFNVFGTFGAVIYIDLGWFFYILFFILLYITIIYTKIKWSELKFHRVFFLIILIAFFSRSLFGWPFVGHYCTYALFSMIVFSILFRFRYRI